MNIPMYTLLLVAVSLIIIILNAVTFFSHLTALYLKNKNSPYYLISAIITMWGSIISWMSGVFIAGTLLMWGAYYDLGLQTVELPFREHYFLAGLVFAGCCILVAVNFYLAEQLKDHPVWSKALSFLFWLSLMAMIILQIALGIFILNYAYVTYYAPAFFIS